MNVENTFSTLVDTAFENVYCWNFWGRYQNLTLKQINKKFLDIKVPMLKINKSELKTNETLITQVKNALFYKADRKSLHKSLQTENVYIKVLMQEIIHKTMVTLKTVWTITCLLLSWSGWNQLSFFFLPTRRKLKIS